MCDFDADKTTTSNIRCFSIKEVIPPQNGHFEFPLRKVLDRETREIKTLKKEVNPREVVQIGHDEPHKAQKAQTFGVKHKPDKPPIPSLVESVPKESEGTESPDQAEGQPSAEPPTEEPPTIEEPPKVPQKDKVFSYRHGFIIPERPPDRRTDWRRPDGWDPTEWAISEGRKEALY